MLETSPQRGNTKHGGESLVDAIMFNSSPKNCFSNKLFIQFNLVQAIMHYIL